MTNGNKKKQYQEFTKAEVGIQKNIPAKSQVNIGGKNQTQASLLQVFTTATTAIDAVDAATAQLRQLVESQAAAIQAAHDLYLELKQWALGQFGKGSPILADFGFSVAKPKQKSSATKAIAAAKSKQTRQVHGPVGKRQKQAQTVTGSAGLVLVGPDGKPIPGFTQGPVPPAGKGSTGSTQ